MPTIYRPTKKRKPKVGKQKFISSKIYSTRRWQELRQSVLMQHPICQICNQELATEVHHNPPISTGKTNEEMLDIGFGITSQLLALCHKCHEDLHNKLKQSHLEYNV